MAVLTGKCKGCGRSFELLSAARAVGAIGRSVCSRRCEMVAEHLAALEARRAQR